MKERLGNVDAEGMSEGETADGWSTQWLDQGSIKESQNKKTYDAEMEQTQKKSLIALNRAFS